MRVVVVIVIGVLDVHKLPGGHRGTTSVTSAGGLRRTSNQTSSALRNGYDSISPDVCDEANVTTYIRIAVVNRFIRKFRLDGDAVNAVFMQDFSDTVCNSHIICISRNKHMH
jgi:hypothetical protein